MKNRLAFTIIVALLLGTLITFQSANAFDPVKYQQVKNRTISECNYCDLSGADFGLLYLDGISLVGANLSKARFIATSLTQANLAFANLEGAEFKGADLRGSNLVGARMRHIIISDSPRTNFKFANLTGAWWGDSYYCDYGSIGECKVTPNPQNFQMPVPYYHKR